jgi:hypothetical protein
MQMLICVKTQTLSKISNHQNGDKKENRNGLLVRSQSAKTEEQQKSK